ncbi:MAG: DUF3990 domain-containing protein [Coriobacteriales bacterium]|jgi:hypothetical protein|nr:DUF3990 domain-containing protein [Coriobacteriales bacterium]
MKQHSTSIILYHSSTVEVAEPQWDFAAGTDSERNDFGLGFYTSLNQEQPVMLLCDRPQVVLNQYRLDLTGLHAKTLPNNTEWLLTVTFHRRDFNSKLRLHGIRDAYRRNLSSFDLVIGAIANDRLFSTINAFIENNVTDAVAIACLQLMQYQPQYVFKSSEACSKLEFMGAETYDATQLVAFRQRVVQERAMIDDRVTQIKEQRFREGQLLSEILREKVNDESQVL